MAVSIHRLDWTTGLTAPCWINVHAQHAHAAWMHLCRLARSQLHTRSYVHAINASWSAARLVRANGYVAWWLNCLPTKMEHLLHHCRSASVCFCFCCCFVFFNACFSSLSIYIRRNVLNVIILSLPGGLYMHICYAG